MPIPHISDHAVKRSQQRGIPVEAMNTLISHGRRRYSGGGVSYMMDRGSRRRARTAIGESTYKRIQPWLDCYVVVSFDQTNVITVAHRLRKLLR